MCLLAALFGWQGFYSHEAAVENQRAEAEMRPAKAVDRSVVWFKTAQLLILNAGGDERGELLWVARVLASVGFYTLSFTILTRLWNWTAEWWAYFRTGHVVIFDLKSPAIGIAAELNAVKLPLVAVSTDPADDAQPQLQKAAEEVITGEHRSLLLAQKSGAANAREVYLLSANDLANRTLRADIRQLAGARPAPQIYCRLGDAESAEELNTLRHDAYTRYFNLPQMAAKKWVTRDLIPFIPRKPEEVAHFVIVGFGSIGRTLALTVARYCHFTNGKRSRLTIVTPNRSAGREFVGRYPRFTTWNERTTGIAAFSPAADQWDYNYKQNPSVLPATYLVRHDIAVQYACNAKFINAKSVPTTSDLVQKLLPDIQQPNVKTVVLVCDDDLGRNRRQAEEIRRLLSGQNCADTPVFAWLPDTPENVAHCQAAGVSIFGDGAQTLSRRELVDPLSERIAPKLFDAYRDYMNEGVRKRNLKAGAKIEQEDTTTWESLSERLRESNRQSAEHLLVKLAHYELRLCRRGEVGVAANDLSLFDKIVEHAFGEIEHNRWMAERLLSDWKYVPEPPTKEGQRLAKAALGNWLLVPWAEVHGDDKKDFVIVKAALTACGENGLWLAKLKP